jgi:hypothetical protein
VPGSGCPCSRHGSGKRFCCGVTGEQSARRRVVCQRAVLLPWGDGWAALSHRVAPACLRTTLDVDFLLQALKHTTPVLDNCRDAKADLEPFHWPDMPGPTPWVPPTAIIRRVRDSSRDLPASPRTLVAALPESLLTSLHRVLQGSAPCFGFQQGSAGLREGPAVLPAPAGVSERHYAGDAVGMGE